MSRKTARRRNRLIVGGVLAAVIVGGGVTYFALSNSDAGERVTAQDEDITPSARGFLEPPVFAERVAAGELPPIDERLPVEPFVVGADVLLDDQYVGWEDGRYGGTINYASIDPTGMMNMAGGASLLRSPGQSTAESLPNVLSAFEHSADYTEFTLTIREGLRWSDGELVSTEDVRFPIEDLYGNPDANRPAPSWLHTQGDPAQDLAAFEAIDENTFTLTFAAPYGQFVAELNSWIPSYTEILKPAHYLKQFHADYADAADLQALVAENSRNDWQTLLEYKDVLHWDVGQPRALGLPVLNAWVMVKSGESVTEFERNPYYWHVDASGHQLPYVDRMIATRVVDSDAGTNAILAGQVDLATGGEASLNNMSIFTQNAERSGLNVFTTGSFNSPLQLFLNRDFEWDAANSQWQSIISDSDLRFQRAIAAAIDDQAINDSVYFGLFKDLDPAWRTYDPELANQLLDDLGMKPGSGGARTYPDGSPFVLTLTYTPQQADMTPVAELLREQLSEVGISTELESIDTSLWDQRKASNQIMASMIWNDGQGWASGISEDYLPAHKGPWSPAVHQYFLTNGERGREPDAQMKEFYALHVARKEVPPQSDEGVTRWEAVKAWLQDNYAFIPITGDKVTPTVVNKDLRNVPKDGAPVELDVYINTEGFWFDLD